MPQPVADFGRVVFDVHLAGPQVVSQMEISESENENEKKKKTNHSMP